MLRVNYFVLGMWLGRSVIYKFADSRVGRMLLLSSEKLKKSEEFFNKYGKLSTFIGRFIPVIRHFISIPAGFSKMNPPYPAFAIFTFIGAGLWNCILALLGYMAHGQQDTINRYSHEIGYGLLVLAALLVIYFVVRYIIRKKKKQNVCLMGEKERIILGIDPGTTVMGYGITESCRQEGGVCNSRYNKSTSY